MKLVEDFLTLNWRHGSTTSAVIQLRRIQIETKWIWRCMRSIRYIYERGLEFCNPSMSMLLEDWPIDKSNLSTNLPMVEDWWIRTNQCIKSLRNQHNIKHSNTLSFQMVIKSCCITFLLLISNHIYIYINVHVCVLDNILCRFYDRYVHESCLT